MQFVRNFRYSRESLQFINVLALILYTSIAPVTLLLFNLQLNWQLVLFIPLVLLVITVHEYLHLIVLHYYKITTTVITSWKLLLPKISVTYTGTLSRNQLLLVNLLPFTLMTCGTALTSYLLYQIQWLFTAKLLLYILLLNAVGSLQDIYMSYLIIQYPVLYFFVVNEDSVEIWR